MSPLHDVRIISEGLSGRINNVPAGNFFHLSPVHSEDPRAQMYSIMTWFQAWVVAGQLSWMLVLFVQMFAQANRYVYPVKLEAITPTNLFVEVAQKALPHFKGTSYRTYLCLPKVANIIGRSCVRGVWFCLCYRFAFIKLKVSFQKQKTFHSYPCFFFPYTTYLMNIESDGKTAPSFRQL